MPLRVRLECTDLVEKSGVRLILLTLENPGHARVVSVRSPQSEDAPLAFDAPHGVSEHWLRVPAKTVGAVRFVVDGATHRLSLKPPRRWTIHLVNHTHTDLGYTDYQPVVFRDFHRFLLEAMELVRETRRFPEAARFRFTIETGFQLRCFLRRATPRQTRELARRVREGHFTLSAVNMQMTDLPNADMVQRACSDAHGFARRYDVPIGPAMCVDINGLPWSLPTVLHDLGVRELSMCVNDDMARPPLPPRPRPFWWEPAPGKRLLVWNSEGYCIGNRCRLEIGVDEALSRVARHLAGLADNGYPFEHAAMFSSGVAIDCAPPTINQSVTAREWNARFANPTLRLSTLAEWFAQTRKMVGRSAPVFRGHWPDYWAHGLGSAVDEVRLVREAQHLLTSAGVAGALANVLHDHYAFPAVELDAAYEQAELAMEHTWGAAASIGAPYSDVARLQWQCKRQAFYEARLRSELTLKEALERHGTAATHDGPCVVVHNPLPWPRAGVAELDGIQRRLPEYRVEALRDPATNDDVPFWREPQDGTIHHLRVPVTNVPAAGFLTLPAEQGRAGDTLGWSAVSGPVDRLENAFYRVRVDAKTGQITSLYDKQLKRELVKRDAALPFGRFIHEKLPGPAARHWANRADRTPRVDPESFRRTQAVARKRRRFELAGTRQRLDVEGACRGLTGVAWSIRLHEREKRVDFEWRLTLPEHTDPHAGYVAFPLAGAAPKLWIETAGGPMQPGVDQIPTTCCDFYTAQNFVRVETGGVAVTLVPRDTPLIEFNEISTFQFREKPPKFNGTVVSWLFNNYWHTNFPASQPGAHVFRYSLTSGRRKAHDMAASYRFAYEVANPLRAHFIADTPLKRRATSTATPGRTSFFELAPANVLVTSVRPSETGEGYVFRLQEIAGRATQAVLTFPQAKPRGAVVCDLFEQSVRRTTCARGVVKVRLQPFEAKAIRVLF